MQTQTGASDNGKHLKPSNGTSLPDARLRVFADGTSARHADGDVGAPVDRR